MLPESGCKSKKENLKSSRFRYITIYVTTQHPYRKLLVNKA